MRNKIKIKCFGLRIEPRSLKLQALLFAFVLASTVGLNHSQADMGTCGGAATTLPFMDVSGNTFFCLIAEIYFLGITVGTSPTTYSPANNVTREQMAAFLSRTMNVALKRVSRRAALNQFWTTTPQYEVAAGSGMLGTTAVGAGPRKVASDGVDIWVTNGDGDTVSRVRASDGKLLGTWTGVDNPGGVLAAMGRVFVSTNTTIGRLYMIDPSQPAGVATLVADTLGSNPQRIVFDGARIWTANLGGSLSIITPGSPFTVVNKPGFSSPSGLLFNGANIWVTVASTTNNLLKLDANGNILQSITVGHGLSSPIFDGTNIWVPGTNPDSVIVVRPSDGMVLATLSGNGLDSPFGAAFDGQRVLVINLGGDSVSLWNAADLTPLGSVSTGAGSSPNGVCSDGLNFWIALYGAHKLARF